MARTRSSAQLVRAALDLIAEGGLDRLTLREVAQRAGVSRATAYREFRDKDGLLGAIAEQEIGAMIAATVAAFDPQADPTAQTAAIVTTALRYLRTHQAFVYVRDHEPHWLLYAGLPVGNSRMNLVQTVAAMVAQAIPPSDELALTPVAAAEVVVRTVLSHALIEDSALTEQEVAEVVSRAITRR
ncbi:TetR family transcriptional regulator [Mycolicibacterium novocastrense]|uniref:TetR/AcrR family transcriptional regulator n=1 Tax=Mycolicibacterium novocastrense TaxID=59813 RepID=UPI000745FDE8|nr:TetR/AcrR family transcriptional regulator [Mycolicibacterium novocastrense]KUH68915.1 TetR family transcriptional regulator [Mycolicibacterium novocastrense]KUH71100.1 TetR family transcriptional regulator [Mycolicibacterium novocastrense]KUH72230.1 TetR family transcriptional regulator [Mycolicibacterium novocastrense]KUH72278.1 TetR family transcriptional regulator [Mycolicibacterium novocastrense]